MVVTSILLTGMPLGQMGIKHFPPGKSGKDSMNLKIAEKLAL
jgi:hypothetical protein